MTLRLSGHFSTFGFVFFALKFLLGIARQWSYEKFAILTLKPRSHVRILIYRTWAIWSWANLETSKTKVNYSVDFVGHRELALFFKFFTIGREYTLLTTKIVSWDIGGTYHFDLGWVRGWYSGQSRGWSKYVFSWFEIFRPEIFWDKPFLAVNLFKYSKYSLFFGVDFSFHGSSPSLGIWSTPPV